MQRAPVVLTATVAGLAATIGFHAHRPPTAPASAAATTTSSSGSSASSSGSSGSSSTSSSSSSGKTVTSDAVATRYGNVQLKVTVANGKITSIVALQLPSGDPKSYEISGYAEPLLRQSALSKQNGSIDAVSGATYTSGGYQTALQAALDQAGFGGTTTSSGSTS